MYHRSTDNHADSCPHRLFQPAFDPPLYESRSPLFLSLCHVDNLHPVREKIGRHAAPFVCSQSGRNHVSLNIETRTLIGFVDGFGKSSVLRKSSQTAVEELNGAKEQHRDQHSENATKQGQKKAKQLRLPTEWLPYNVLPLQTAKRPPDANHADEKQQQHKHPIRRERHVDVRGPWHRRVQREGSPFHLQRE